MTKYMRLLPLVILGAILCGCDKEPHQPATVSLIALQPTLSLELGAKHRLEAIVMPTDAVNKDVLWKSDQSSIAWVDPSTGEVEACGVGYTNITATATDGSGIKATCVVTVSFTDILPYIPDAAFRKWCLSNVDKDNDGKVSPSEAKSRRMLGVTWSQTLGHTESDRIVSLEGIEYFQGLTHLYCQGNLLTSLDVSANHYLEVLDCSRNALMTLDVSHNMELYELFCGENELTSLNISKKNDKLSYLICPNNKLTALDLLNCIELYQLDCSGNNIVTLDVSKCIWLERLNCSTNRLTALDVSKNTLIWKLLYHNNPGNGAVFPITAWFDNSSIPEDLQHKASWAYGNDGRKITVDFRKNE